MGDVAILRRRRTDHWEPYEKQLEHIQIEMLKHQLELNNIDSRFAAVQAEIAASFRRINVYTRIYTENLNSTTKRNQDGSRSTTEFPAISSSS